MRVEVVIPFAGDCPYRRRALGWIRRRYAEQAPEWKLTVATTSGPWIKADAVNPAIDASSADVIVVADADCWSDGLAKAVAKIAAGVAWTVPHGLVYRLSESGSDAYMTGRPLDDLPWARKPYRGLEGGGFVIAPRQTLLQVPLDRSFTGWGQEDASWGLALYCLAGTPWRGNAPLIHLWHPPQEIDLPKWGSLANKRRHRLYVQARRHPGRMRELTEGRA